MISERTKRILSEEISEDEERTVIFLEEGDESFAFRLFRATEVAGDPAQRAIRCLGRALSRPSRRTEDRGDSVQSRDERDCYSIMQEAGGQGMAGEN